MDDLKKDRLKKQQLNYLLKSAIKRNNYSDVKKLLSLGAFVNPSCSPGKTPLELAVQNGQNRIIRLLLENKANPNVRDDIGITPLKYAALIHADPYMVRLLVHFGAKLPQIENSWLTKLIHRAIKETQATSKALYEIYNFLYDERIKVKELTKFAKAYYEKKNSP